METNEYLQTALRQEAEVEVLKLVESLPTLKEGDLKGVETHVLERIMSVGRKWMECILSHESPCEPPPVRREGACGHEQHLVGVRPKQLLTMLGKVTFCRPYYQCVRSEQAEAAGNKQECSHGEAPADAIWGVQARRTSAGVQQAISYLCASLTLEEAAETFSRLLPLGMSARQALNLMQPVGEGLACAEEKQVAALWEQAPRARSELTVAAPPSKRTLNASTSNWTGSRLACAGAVCRWKTRSSSEQGMSIGKSKWERSLQPHVADNALRWLQGSSSITPARSTM